MPAQLIALNEGSNILLDKPILLVGRDPECDVQIDSRKISRRHCIIAQVNDYLVVRDLESTNGIRVNGVRVQEGKLRTNDELTVGSSRYRVSWDLVPALPPGPVEDPGYLPTSKSGAVSPDEVGGTEDAVFEFDSSDEPVALQEAEDIKVGTAKVEAAKPAVKPAPPKKDKEPDWRRATSPLPPSDSQPVPRKPKPAEPDWRRVTAPLPPDEIKDGIIPDDLDLLPLKDDDSQDAKKK